MKSMTGYILLAQLAPVLALSAAMLPWAAIVWGQAPPASAGHPVAAGRPARPR